MRRLKGIRCRFCFLTMSQIIFITLILILMREHHWQPFPSNSLLGLTNSNMVRCVPDPFTTRAPFCK